MQPRKSRKAMKNIFIMCLLVLVGEALMAQNSVANQKTKNSSKGGTFVAGNALISTKIKPDVPGYGGNVYVRTKFYINPDNKPIAEFAGVPYAQICLIIDGKDTVRLTCDALGNYFWKTDKTPKTLEYHIITAGFEKCIIPHVDQLKDANWKNIRFVCKKHDPPLNKVNISANKVEVTTIQGDIITYPVKNAFKTIEGDFVGNLLRKLPGFAMENGFLTLNGQPIHYIELDDYKQYDEFAKLTEANIKRRVEQEKEAQKKGETQ